MSLFYAPVCLFVYNRPNLLEITLKHLSQNELAKNTDLYIFSDAPKTCLHNDLVLKVRNLIKIIPSDSFKTIKIIEREKNWGLASSIIDGVTRILEKYGKIIVLEDDLITSKFFLTYMNDALNMYEKNENVASIHGWSYPLSAEGQNTYFLRGTDCWGWATWKRAWKNFEPDANKLLAELKKQNLQKQFDLNGAYPFVKMLKLQIKGKINSWAIRWHASAFVNNMITLHPNKSMVQNIGIAHENATHTIEIDKAGIFSNPIDIENKINLTFIECKENTKKREEIIVLLKKNISQSFFAKLKRRFFLLREVISLKSKEFKNDFKK